MIRRTVTCLLAALLALASPLIAHASTEEPAGIDLGGSSFMDGFGRTSQGFVYQQYLLAQHYDSIAGPNGREPPIFRGTDLKALVSLNQLIYVSPYHLLGAAVGAEALLPIVHLDAGFAPDSPVKLTADRGPALGDLTWGVFLQMPPVTWDGQPVFAERFDFDVISPTGRYDRADDINPGSGFWSLNPYWAMTFLPTSSTELSIRLNYLHNFKNSAPAGAAPPFRAGDAAWANFTASYKVLPDLNLGVNGYYFRQFQNDTASGRTVPHSETTNLSIGPGLMYQADARNALFLNAYLPLIERNTPHGFRLVARWVHVF
jgi:hypothetical protein